MRFLFILFIAYSFAFSVTFLPYQSLYTKLTQTNIKLQALKDINNLKSAIQNYSANINELKTYSNSLLEKEKFEKKDQMEYLKKLRKMDSQYQHILYMLRNSVDKSITSNDLSQFKKIMDTNLKEILNKEPLKSSSIEFYKKHRSKYHNKILEDEIKLQKEIQITKEKEAEYLADLEAKKNKKTVQTAYQNNTTQNNINTTSSEPVPARLLRSSKLDSNKEGIREKKFTRWLSKREHQDRYDTGYYKKYNVYPAYVEMNQYGNRRVIEIPYEPKFYWATNSGISFKDFKKNNALRELNGKKLISLYIYEFDGVKLYTGTWISKNMWAREVAKLKKFGINPPSI